MLLLLQYNGGEKEADAVSTMMDFNKKQIIIVNRKHMLLLL